MQHVSWMHLPPGQLISPKPGRWLKSAGHTIGKFEQFFSARKSECTEPRYEDQPQEVAVPNIVVEKIATSFSVTIAADGVSAHAVGAQRASVGILRRPSMNAVAPECFRAVAVEVVARDVFVFGLREQK